MLMHAVSFAQVTLNGRELVGILIAVLGMILAGLVFIKALVIPKGDHTFSFSGSKGKIAFLQFAIGMGFIVTGIWVGGFLSDSQEAVNNHDVPNAADPNADWLLGEEIITCQVVNVSLKNNSTKTVNTFREMKDKDENVVAKNTDPQPPGGYANLGWTPPAGYSGVITWIIIFNDPETGAELYTYEDHAKLDCP